MTGKALIDLLNPQPGERILDVGCGMGELAAEIARRGAKVTGIDVLPTLLEQARHRYPHVEFIQADLLNYETKKPFDGILAHAVLHWVNPPQAAARQLFKLLRRGGRLAGTLGGAASAVTGMPNYYMPSAKDYQALLAEAGFRGIRITEESGKLVVLASRPS